LEKITCFPKFNGKSDELKSNLLWIPDLIAPFAPFRHKMTSENVLIVAFWTADRMPDGLMLAKKEKNPLFGDQTGDLPRRTPT
jgi:hypothetical protein